MLLLAWLCCADPMPKEAAPLFARIDADVYPYEPLVCRTSEGAQIQWLRDDEPFADSAATLFAGDTVPAGHATAGETWTCIATWDDGTARSSLTLPLAPHNVLLLIADDMGVDKFAPSGLALDAPFTPRLDALAAQGVIFDNAYAYNTCTPTRAAMLTGRFGRRTGTLDLLGPPQTFELPSAEITIPEMLTYSDVAYDSSAMGKWHMGWHVSGPTQPLQQGFGWFGGSKGNLNVGASQGYFDWQKYVAAPGEEPEVLQVSTYATTDTTNDAIARVQAMPEPWFAWVAYNAPHYPFEPPPDALLPAPFVGDTPKDIYDAMVTGMDTEVGRLLDSLDPATRARTTIVFVGDNGSNAPVIRAPFDPSEGKFTLFEGGIHVPLVVSGPLVGEPGSRSQALVSVLDVFPTVAAIAGVPLDALQRPDGSKLVLDGVSLLRWLDQPGDVGRSDLFMEDGDGFGTESSIVGDVLEELDYKLIRYPDGDELYDKRTSPHDEGEDLLTGELTAEDEAAWLRMGERLKVITSGLSYENDL